MAITNSIKKILPGFGIAGISHATASSTTITSNAVTATASSISPTLNAGYIRVKASNVDSSHGLASIVVTVTDGVTTEYVENAMAIGGANGQGAEYLVPFISDLNVNSVTAVVTGATGVTTLTVDLEVYGPQVAQ